MNLGLSGQLPRQDAATERQRVRTVLSGMERTLPLTEMSDSPSVSYMPFSVDASLCLCLRDQGNSVIKIKLHHVPFRLSYHLIGRSRTHNEKARMRFGVPGKIKWMFLLCYKFFSKDTYLTQLPGIEICTVKHYHISYVHGKKLSNQIYLDLKMSISQNVRCKLSDGKCNACNVRLSCVRKYNYKYSCRLSKIVIIRSSAIR